MLLAWVFIAVRVGEEEGEAEVGLDIQRQQVGVPICFGELSQLSVSVLRPWLKAALGARIWEEGEGLCADIFRTEQ